MLFIDEYSILFLKNLPNVTVLLSAVKVLSIKKLLIQQINNKIDTEISVKNTRLSRESLLINAMHSNTVEADGSMYSSDSLTDP